MLVKISWYDGVICGTLECKHVCSWNVYDDELCDYQMQMC